jgi:hypothetical protein
VRLLLATVLLVAIASGCGSSSKSANSSATTTVAGGTSGGSCPFSGSTQAQTTPAGPVPSVVLQSVSPRRAGCIDNVQFAFKPAIAASQVAYEGTTTTLRVRLKGASLGSSFTSGATVAPDGLAYVKAIKVDASAASGEVDWLFTLDKVRPFLLSSSQAPPLLQVAIG